MKRQLIRTAVSFLLIFVLVLGLVPGAAWAAETEKTESHTETISTTTTTTKTVYKLTSTLTAGKQYLIVSSNSTGTAYALANNNGSASATGVTITNDSSLGQYIDLADAVDELWTVGGSYSFKNGNQYLSYSGFISYSISLDTTSKTWTYSNDSLYGPSTTGYATVYLWYENGWTVGAYDGGDVYFYEPTTVTITEENSVTYSVSSSDISHAYEVGGIATETSTISASVLANDIEVSDLNGSYSYVLIDDSSGIINSLNINQITFSGNSGTAQIRVYYTFVKDAVEYKIWDTITVTATHPTYTVDITHDDDGDASTADKSVTAPIVIKKVTADTTYDLNAVVTYGTPSSDGVVENPVISWSITSDPDGAASDVDENGVVSFTGVDGTVQISVYYELPDGSAVYDTVTFSVTKSEYVLPGDGSDDFPEYPNEGAIRIDKTATAVGNFSETGLAMVELAMTGVPYTKGSEIDVVIMIDMSTSMTTARITAARESAVEALQAIVTNEDGTYNDNRVAVYTFNGWDGSGQSGVAQNYANAVDEVLALQSYTTATSVTNATNTINSAITSANTDAGTNYAAALNKCDEVLYSARQADGYNRKQFVIFVTDGVPTTGFAYVNSSGGVSDAGYYGGTSGNASALVGYTEYYSNEMKKNGVQVYTVGIHLEDSNTDAHTILEKIAGTKEGNAYSGGGEYVAYAQFVAEDESADKLKDIFETFVTAIKQAATNVTVEDKISEDYSMVFERPTGLTDAQTGGQDYYIQIVEYTLNNETKVREGDPVVLEKFWIDEDGDWQHISGTTTCTNCTHVKIENGKVTSISGTYFATSFDYDADSQMLIWKADKLDNKELALQYFVYLDNSANGSGESGTYPTNEYANVTYTNYQDNLCQQEFPVPRLTYNGAQVSYVFYLVNEKGEPVNRAGRVVPFSEAVFVTDVLTKATTWKVDGSREGKLEETYLVGKIPTVFTLYDPDAYYEIHVFENPANPDYFILEGSKTGSTKVFNTKAGVRYDAWGAYSATKGTYTSGQNKTYEVGESKATAMAGFDFANTTVAFAVTWTAELLEDTAVMDFGLPVIIDVAANDVLSGSVVGVRDSEPSGVAINSGTFTAARRTDTVIRDPSGNIIGNAYVVSGTSVMVVLSKVLDEPVEFYYEYEAKFYDDETLVTTCFYSSVTLIPATNVLYEESYIYGNKGWNSDASGVGTAAGTAQSEKNEGPYGFDKAYQTSIGSGGTQYIASLTPDGVGRFADNISFTFTGTGFDLIGSCSSDTATLMVRVSDAEGNYVKGYMVDTAFLNTFNEDEKSYADGDGKIYQVPLVHEDGLTWGTYTVTITGAYVAYDYQETSPSTMTLEIDGFRVYRTGAAAEHAAFVSGEQGVTYVNIMSEVQALSDAIAYVDSAETGYSVSNYERVGGPENEVYVKPGQSIVLKTTAVWHQVSLRSVTEMKTAAVLKTDESQVEYDITHNTEMYYSLEGENSGILTITNTGNSLLAVGNVKLYSDGTDTASLVAVSAEDLPVVYAMLSRPVEPMFHPEDLTMETNAIVQSGQKFVTLTVTASTDVRKLTVNGTAVWASNYTRVQQGLDNKYIFTILQIVSPDETATFEVTARDKDGIAAEFYTTSE